MDKKEIQYWSLCGTNQKKNMRFFSYSDIATEFGTTRGSVAGKFYRARQAGKSIIDIDGNKILQMNQK